MSRGTAPATDVAAAYLTFMRSLRYVKTAEFASIRESKVAITGTATIPTTFFIGRRTPTVNEYGCSEKRDFAVFAAAASSLISIRPPRLRRAHEKTRRGPLKLPARPAASRATPLPRKYRFNRTLIRATPMSNGRPMCGLATVIRG
jgi:hypothetical protein